MSLSGPTSTHSLLGHESAHADKMPCPRAQCTAQHNQSLKPAVTYLQLSCAPYHCPVAPHRLTKKVFFLRCHGIDSLVYTAADFEIDDFGKKIKLFSRSVLFIFSTDSASMHVKGGSILFTSSVLLLPCTCTLYQTRTVPAFFLFWGGGLATYFLNKNLRKLNYQFRLA